MGSLFDNTELVKAAEAFLAAAKSFNGDAGARADLMQRAYGLRYLTEDASGMLFRHWESIHSVTALDVLTTCGVLQNIPPGGTAGSKELGEATGLDESVVRRAMGLVCVQGIGEEVSADVYAHNEKSLALITGNGQYFMKFMLLFNHSLYRRYPEYFKTHAPQDIFDDYKNPFAWAVGEEGKSFWEVIRADPERAIIFHRAMTVAEGVVPTRGCYDFSAMKEKVEAEPDRAFIVDVGGGRGTSLMSIQAEAPAGFGAAMILQDREDVIAQIRDEDIPNITKMVHNAFQPNPIKNAHLYFFRRVIHSYADADCEVILKQIAAAMGPTSRLLVGEFILPERARMGDDLMARWLDFAMISVSGQERRLSDYEKLFDSAGLELVKVWPFVGKGYPQSILEAKLKGS